jgi:hypothetical protein
MSKEDKTLEGLLTDTLKSNGFADILAHNIAMQFGEKLMDDFGNQITEKLDKYVESTVEQYVKDYSTQERIRSNIQEMFRRIGKDELIGMIRSDS